MTDLAIEHLLMAELSARTMGLKEVIVTTSELALALAKIERLRVVLQALLDEWAHGRDGIQAETVASAHAALRDTTP